MASTELQSRSSAETATDRQEEQRAVCQAVERPMMGQDIGPQVVANRADDGRDDCAEDRVAGSCPH